VLLVAVNDGIQPCQAKEPQLHPPVPLGELALGCFIIPTAYDLMLSLVQSLELAPGAFLGLVRSPQ
jgi:hypothetical protein